MKGLSLLLAAMALVISVPLAMAEPFIREPENTSRFHSNLGDFGRSLDDAGRNMRSDYDYHNSMNAQQQRAFYDAVQADTGAVSQQMFQASQMQAASSGGLYNGNGSNNMGYGYAIVPVVPPGAQPGYYGSAAAAQPPVNNGPFSSPYSATAPGGNYYPASQQNFGFNWGIGSASSNGTTSSNTTQSNTSK
jgi:hypothetical protein